MRTRDLLASYKVSPRATIVQSHEVMADKKSIAAAMKFLKYNLVVGDTLVMFIAHPPLKKMSGLDQLKVLTAPKPSKKSTKKV